LGIVVGLETPSLLVLVLEHVVPTAAATVGGGVVGPFDLWQRVGGGEGRLLDSEKAATTVRGPAGNGKVLGVLTFTPNHFREDTASSIDEPIANLEKQETEGGELTYS
jgi:hypothetical protein